MYTKGPWHWEEDFPNAVDKNALVNESGDIVLQPVTGWDRCDKGIRTGGQHDGRDGSATDETKDNARLIEAAPELLEALKKAHYELAALVPHPDSVVVDDWPCDNKADSRCLQIAYDAIGDAIAKAEGK